MGAFANVLIEENDGKSASICITCEEKLKSSLEFRRNVQEAERRLICSGNLTEGTHPAENIKLEDASKEEEIYEYEFLDDFPEENSKNGQVGNKNGSTIPHIDNEELLKVFEAPENENTNVDFPIESEIHEENIVEDEPFKFSFEMPPDERIAKRLKFGDFEYLEIDGDRCCGCSFIAANRDELQQHSKSNHSQHYYADSGYTCPTCYQKFQTQDRLANHIDYYSYSDVFLCAVCNESFVHKNHLKTHQESCHMLQSQELVAIRKPKVKRRSKLTTRLIRPQIGTGEIGPTYVCCFVRCWDGFNTEDELLAHVQQVHDGKRRENDLAILKQSKALKTHICSVCHRLFESESKLHCHLSYKQRRDEYICLECGKSFHKTSLLRDHELKDHSTLSPQHGCEVCGKHFWKESVLKTHRKIHVPFENVQCSEPGCELVFRDTALMKRHCRNVHGEMPWQCRFCPKKLRTKEAIDIHERVHTKEKPFACRHGCDRRFAHATDRVRHERSVHTSEKPHKCDQCTAAYVRRRELVLHFDRSHRSDEK